MTSPPHLSASAVGASAIPAVGRELRTIFSVLDEMPAGVLVLDTDGLVKYANPIAELRLDQQLSEILGADFFRVVVPQLDLEGLGARYRVAMAGGRVGLASEVEVDEGKRRLNLGIRSFDVNGTMLSMVLIEDRSTLAREEERRKWAERLAAVGELAAGVAHEVNNPLASIKSFAQLLAREAGPDQRQGLEIIDREATRIARTIDNLLGFARQQEVSEREATDFSALVEHVIGLRRYALQSVGVEIEAELEPDPSPVRGQVGALQRLVLQLIVRAERALHARDEHRRIKIRVREASDGVILRVSDNGPGLARAQLATLFDGREDASPQEAAVELAMAASIVREHGGHIWAESSLARGTTLFVRLPRAELERPAAPAVVAPPAAEPVAPGLRVLLADDEPALRLAVSLFLRRNGHEVVEAPDAHEALRLATESHFDVALVDARMPGDGVALVGKLQRIPHLRGHVALMSGDSKHVADAAGEDATVPFVLKPFELTDIVRLVEHLGR